MNVIYDILSTYDIHTPHTLSCVNGYEVSTLALAFSGFLILVFLLSLFPYCIVLQQHDIRRINSN